MFSTAPSIRTSDLADIDAHIRGAFDPEQGGEITWIKRDTNKCKDSDSTSHFIPDWTLKNEAVSEFYKEFKTPTWANYDANHANTKKIKDIWDFNNGVYGSYKVNSSYWLQLPTMELLDGIYKRHDPKKYLFVKWLNVQPHKDDTD